MSRVDVDERLGRGCGRPDRRHTGDVVEVLIPERGRRTLCLVHTREAVEEHGARLVDEGNAAVSVGGDA